MATLIHSNTSTGGATAVTLGCFPDSGPQRDRHYLGVGVNEKLLVYRRQRERKRTSFVLFSSKVTRTLDFWQEQVYSAFPENVLTTEKMEWSLAPSHSMLGYGPGHRGEEAEGTSLVARRCPQEQRTRKVKR